MAAVSRKRTIGRRDFESVLRRGARVQDGPMRLYWRKLDPNTPSTFGLSVKNGTLKRAVDRNRWKRIVREAIRSVGYTHSRGFEVIFVLVQTPPGALSGREWKPSVIKLLHAAGAC